MIELKPIVTGEYEAIPQGEYLAEFVDVDKTTTSNGDALRWIFKVVEGDHTGSTVSGLTDETPTIRNKCGRYIAAMEGSQPSDGMTVDLASKVGRRYLVNVNEKGSLSLYAPFRPVDG